MSETVRLKNTQLRYNELELRRHLLERGCLKSEIKRLLEKYTGIQLGAEHQLWSDLPITSIHRPYVQNSLASTSPLPENTLERLTNLSGIKRLDSGLNRGHFTVQNFPDLKDKPNARSGSDYDLRQNVIVWQKPEIVKMEGFVRDNPDSLFVLNTYARAHIERGAVMLPAINYCLGAIFRNSIGNISAMHMHRAEQPSIDDVAGLIDESSRLFGNNNVAGGHLTLIGMEFPWELLSDRPEPKIPLLYNSPQIISLCNANGITSTRIPVGMDQKEIRVWQAYATTMPADPIVATVDITRQEGFSIVPKGYRELTSELTEAYNSEP
ncbi:MAG TPA: hypothetical protein PKU95_03165 [Candidatus Dojkabacteria bacterium]|nr:hypothetical protein [Candidatus Dojkabacteria bacterium]